jgi:hypothetical protein
MLGGWICFMSKMQLYFDGGGKFAMSWMALGQEKWGIS